jgi:hypothetical protein
VRLLGHVSYGVRSKIRNFEHGVPPRLKIAAGY